MSVMLSCAGALAWARTTIFPDLTYAEIGKLAETAPLGANGATFLPYLTGERSPHNDPSARAAFGGLSLSTDRACLARAVFEGVTAGLMDGFEVLQSLGAKSDEVRVSGGGAKGDFWVQTVADMFGAPCVKMEAEEGPSMGAAILAGVGIGLWSSVEEAVRIVKTKDRIEPSGAEYSEVRARYANLYASLREWSTESAS
jgi:xylulokinase